ncbi:hypothetical protein [Aquimarina sp. MAR_2010_214]|uniref:hypothetical protein n=1 Tax=Aquimarina sp. MAR_2010_214 TaxID=1250026 RepID=UPI0011789D4E|nr:hypothetical protein [Aquimarina sp. MAR_2010_214]
MEIGHLKNYIAYTFIVIFLSLKVAGLHVITHDDNTIEHCEVCDLVTVNNLTPAINDVAQNYIGNNYEFHFQKEVISRYNFVYSTATNFTNLFSRPPPFLV